MKRYQNKISSISLDDAISDAAKSIRSLIDAQIIESIKQIALIKKIKSKKTRKNKRKKA